MLPVARYQLIAIDLDGTLLDSDGRLPARNREALHRAHQAGLKIVLCTGRLYAETRPILDAIGLDLDAAVTVGGAVVTDVATGRTIQRTTIPRALARRVGGFFQSHGHTVLWMIDGDEAGYDGHVIAGPRRHLAVDVWLSRAPVTVRPIDALPGNGAEPVRITVVDESEPLTALSERFRDEFGDSVPHNVIRVHSYNFSVIETFGPRVDKWNGILALCRRWGLDPAGTVAVGDDVNDLPMIRGAGLGVAMRNAVPAVRDAAAMQTGSHDECGVAELIERLLERRSDGESERSC